MTHQSRAAGALEGSHRLSAGLAGRHDGLDAVDRDRLGVLRCSCGTSGERSGDDGDRGAHVESAVKTESDASEDASAE